MLDLYVTNLQMMFAALESVSLSCLTDIATCECQIILMFVVFEALLYKREI